jgi:plasmid stabilization system protein ParE
MREIVWLNSAVSDVVRLREFIAQENSGAAKKAALAIKDAAQRLLETPSIGKPVKDLPLFRDLLVRFGAGGYVLRYRAHAGTIYIVHVRHYREADFRW